MQLEMALAVPSPIRPGLLNRRDPSRPNYSPSGATGNPTLATREKGQKLAEAILRDGVGLASSMKSTM